MISFAQFAFVVTGLIGTIVERIYPPSLADEKFAVGVLLLGSETIGAILNITLALELWFWTLSFGWRWWLDLGNQMEALVLFGDVVVRLRFTGPPEIARCFHVLVLYRRRLS